MLLCARGRAADSAARGPQHTGSLPPRARRGVIGPFQNQGQLGRAGPGPAPLPRPRPSAYPSPRRRALAAALTTFRGSGHGSPAFTTPVAPTSRARTRASLVVMMVAC